MANPFLPQNLNLGSQAHSLCREAPDAREDVTLSRIEFLHAAEVLSQQIFVADFCHAREVVDFLKQSQLVILSPRVRGSSWGLNIPDSSGKGLGRSREKSQWR